MSRAATAEVHPVPMRHGVARQSYWVQASHAKPHRNVSTAHAGKGSPRNSSTRNASSTVGSSRRSATTTTGKGGHSKTRHHAQPQIDDRDTPAFHRVRVKGRATRRMEQANVVAPRHPAAAANDERDPKGPVTAETKHLTVDDFMHAAIVPTTPAGDVNATGESHPDDDVSSLPAHLLTPPMKPLPIQQPMVTARIEAAPESAPAAMEHVAPSDLVGAPIAMPARNTPQSNSISDANTPPVSRQELLSEVEQPLVMPGLYRNGRLVVPAPLKGTREILVHQNIMADDEGLERVQDDFDLRRMRASRQLVDFQETASLHLNPELAGDRRCARPWAVRFAADMARAYYSRFHEPLQVNSAVRTVAYQVRLRRVNGNAAGIDGEAASPHLTGEALDFGKRGMSMEQIAWMRTYLLPLMQSGKLDVEEEFQQACFHISVYRTYLPPSTRRPAVRSEVAQLHAPRVTRARADQDQ